MEALLRRWATSRPDAVLAAGLVLLCLVEVDGELYRGPLQGILLVLPLLSLAWRNRWPAPVAVVVLGTVMVASAASPGQYGPQLPLLATVLALYTVAAQLSGRAAVVVGALTLVLVEIGHLATRDGELADFLPLLVWGAPWAAGRLVRHRTLEAAAVARAAAELAARQEQETREAVARERDRIARELHDVVAHGVSLMVVQAGAERLRLRLDAAADPRTLEVLDAVETAGRTALVELRAMLAVLRPDEEAAAGLSPVPDLAELPHLVQRVQAAGLPVTLHGDVPGDLPAPVSLSAYRIVQEALTNVVKHAPGTRTTVGIRRHEHGVALTVRNALPAVPPQPVDRRPGRGLVGMAERAGLLGGTVEAGPRDEHWVVTVQLPVPSRVPA